MAVAKNQYTFYFPKLLKTRKGMGPSSIIFHVYPQYDDLCVVNNNNDNILRTSNL